MPDSKNLNQPSPGEAPPAKQLEGWYHTIDLGDGRVSQGDFDHRSVVDLYGIPESLEGKVVLDVGTSDGFFAFEMERRGAERVVAIDIARYGDFDWLPQIKVSKGEQLNSQQKHRFEFARNLLGSKVEHQTCSVYDLSPETVGRFDYVFCGSLLLHLMNPLKALVNIRSVTKQAAILETTIDPNLDRKFPDRPVLSFGHRPAESVPGENCVYWHFTRKALEEMLIYAGFSEVEQQNTFVLPPTQLQVATAVARP